MTGTTGIIRDARFLEHITGHLHPEHPNRLKAIHRMLDEGVGEGLLELEAEMATMEQLELVHSPAHVEKVLKTSEHAFTSLAPDTPASAKTYLAAWLAVGGCIRGLEAMLAGECDTCFSLVRPPGHHALPNAVSGFCIFNNLGITARFAAKHHGFERVLIIDWDIHHGHGLNDLFYEEKGVFYFSTHDTLLYPHTGDWTDTGTGEGRGYTVNIPLSRDMEDVDLVSLYQDVLGAVFRSYKPQLVLIAAGFDGHAADPIGRSRFTERMYGDLTRLALALRRENGNPPLLLALEGGYDPPALASSVREVLLALKQDGQAGVPEYKETPRAEAMAARARAVHAEHGVWRKRTL